jgi:glycosyltransferase involved in cell wall biosynthesis
MLESKVQKIVVSVIMITYGHEKYIRQSVESIISQECDFDFELIISNDCSPDDTDAVIFSIFKENSKSHVIKYFSHEINKGMVSNFLWSLDLAKGDYVALCEGDDYWTDMKKLQKQVDFLRSSPKYSATVHAALIEDTITPFNIGLQYDLGNDFDLSMFDIISKGGSVYPTCSLVARKDFLDLIPWKDFSVHGDFISIVFLRKFGLIRFFSKKMACYRIHVNGVHQSTARLQSGIITNRKNILKFHFALFKYLPFKYYLDLTLSTIRSSFLFCYILVKFKFQFK